jgi:hypothetical protein
MYTIVVAKSASPKKLNIDPVNNHHTPGIAHDRVVATTLLALSENTLSMTQKPSSSMRVAYISQVCELRHFTSCSRY